MVCLLNASLICPLAATENGPVVRHRPPRPVLAQAKGRHQNVPRPRRRASPKGSASPPTTHSPTATTPPRHIRARARAHTHKHSHKHKHKGAPHAVSEDSTLLCCLAVQFVGGAYFGERSSCVCAFGSGLSGPRSLLLAVSLSLSLSPHPPSPFSSSISLLHLAPLFSRLAALAHTHTATRARTPLVSIEPWLARGGAHVQIVDEKTTVIETATAKHKADTDALQKK